jgi:protein-disulfide isomerase
MIYKTYQNLAKACVAGAALFLVAACGESGGESGTRVDAEALAAADQVVEGKEGVWGDIVYGDPNAPVTIVEYASLTCPHCATFAHTEFERIQKDFIDTGKVVFRYRNFVMNALDMRASLVARCRDMETTKRLMHVFFGRQQEWARAEDWTGALASIARRTVNMSRTEFDRCASDRDMIKNLTEMTVTASDTFQVNSTPSIFVNGVLAERNDYDTIKELIEQAGS